jgi:hypothetical protein
VARLHENANEARSERVQAAKGGAGSRGWNPSTGLRFRPKTSSSAQRWTALSAAVLPASGPDTSARCDSAERAFEGSFEK